MLQKSPFFPAKTLDAVTPLLRISSPQSVFIRPAVEAWRGEASPRWRGRLICSA
uniref:Uncharacterized protein n=1 Tax=Arundo donax TaxID=35708 RepID=A0A0A9C083_ARUDO